MTMLPAVGTAPPPRWFGPIDAQWARRYVEAAGDDNPLHRDAAAARAAGFAGPILPGMLLLGLAERAVRGWYPGWRIVHLSGQFLAPLCVPDSIAVSARVARVEADAAPPRMVLRLFVRPAVDARMTACIGEAWLSPPPGG